MRSWQTSLVLLIGLVTQLDGTPTAAQANAPYTLEDVLVLVQGGHSAARIVGRISGDCIDFRVDAAAAQLRGAGADDALLTALRGVCYRAPRAATPVATGATPQRGFVRIEGELPPGWTRQVNELPPNTNREIDMTPGRRNFVTVTAPGWCPATLEVTVQAREQRGWKPVLRPRPWVGECPEEGE